MKYPVSLPNEIDQALASGADLAISISGGKDSQAMLIALKALHDSRPDWTGRVLAIHSDLGRAEWRDGVFDTLTQVRKQCRLTGVELVVLKRKRGDLLQLMEERFDKLGGAQATVPFWPGPGTRYCTSYMKRDEIDKYLRAWSSNVVCAVGLRGDESDSRRCKPHADTRKRIQTQTRDAWTWHPILDWDISQVWAVIGTSQADIERRIEQYLAGDPDFCLGFPAHPVYAAGNDRLSCSICIPFGSVGDIRRGARHNPAYARRLVELEQASGFSFRPDLSLSSLILNLQTP